MARAPGAWARVWRRLRPPRRLRFTREGKYFIGITFGVGFAAVNTGNNLLYLVLGLLPEDAADCNTADGRPATIEFARDRLARCICADRESFSREDARAAAAEIHAAQLRLIGAAWSRIAERGALPEVVVVGGQGEFLARALLRDVGFGGRVVSLAAELGEEASRVGPAYALARMAREEAGAWRS